MLNIKKQISRLYLSSALWNLSLTGAWVAILAARGYSLPEIGFDGMPSDLLSALREQVSRAREQQSARQAEPEQAPAVISDATTIGEGYKPAVAEPKLVMPKRKVSGVLRKEEASQAPAETPAPGEGEEIAVTLDSQDFAETMDNRDSADTRTF